ncbi:MAG TPA: NPCBM/NEW2 domain-containing protein, partial [Fimbriimonadaceae bacterium]|nr:NPCBM/NEW2 domain-containing protein [Fimbriimonadaceae bacterium]
MPLLSWRQGWGSLSVDRSVGGRPLTLHGRVYPHGLGTHASSRLVYALDERFNRFHAVVGVDDEMASFGKSSIDFKVVGDGKTLFDSGVMRNSTPPRSVDIDVRGIRELTLIAGDGGDGIEDDHADWADASLVGPAARPRPAAAPYRIVGKGLAVDFDADGRIVSVRLGRRELPVRAQTRLPGTTSVGKARIGRFPNGITVTRPIVVDGHACLQKERFSAGADSVRWQIAISSPGPYWTTPIDTVLECANPQNLKFWTAWQDPDSGHPSANMADSDFPWRDPLEPKPIGNRTWTYGEAPNTNWWSGDIFTLPLFSLMDPAGNRSLTFVQDPNEFIPEGALVTTAGGNVVFARSRRRLGGGHAVRFTMSLVA